MIRRPRRSAPAVAVAAVLLAAAVLTVISCAQALLGRAPLIPFADLAAVGARTSADDPAVIAASAVVAVVGLLLLVPAVTPGPPTVLPLTDGGSGIDTGITRRSLDRALADTARQIDGVAAATVRARRGRVRADVRIAFGDPSELTARVRARLTGRLAEIGPATSPRITVRVARTRNP